MLLSKGTAAIMLGVHPQHSAEQAETRRCQGQVPACKLQPPFEMPSLPGQFICVCYCKLPAVPSSSVTGPRRPSNASQALAASQALEATMLTSKPYALAVLLPQCFMDAGC